MLFLRANAMRKRQSISRQVLSGDKKCSSNRIVFVFWEFLIDSGNGEGVVAGFPNKELLPGLFFLLEFFRFMICFKRHQKS